MRRERRDPEGHPPRDTPPGPSGRSPKPAAPKRNRPAAPQEGPPEAPRRPAGRPGDARPPDAPGSAPPKAPRKPGGARGEAPEGDIAGGSKRRSARGEGAPRPQPRRPAPSKPGAVKPGTGAEADMRLNRYVARSGVCSRRKADELIQQGRVKVDGKVVTELGTRVEEGQEVEVNGTIISPRGHLYLLLNKPEDVITTTDDERGRPTVLDLVHLPPKEMAGLFPVGRLDRDTMGVLLLTNDGELAHRLMHPRYEVDKLYRVRTRLPVKPHELDTLRKGMDLEDGQARADDVAYLDAHDHREIGMRLHEGRNRIVRRMMEALGHEVLRLERVNYAGLTSEGVRRGHWRRLTAFEVKRLRRLVKLP